jgi:hypothetical protein
MPAGPARVTMRRDALLSGGAPAIDTKEIPVLRTRRTVMALTAMGLLFVASACGDGGEGNGQAASDVESATPAAHGEQGTRQSAKSTAGSAADSGTTSTTSSPAADSDGSGDSAASDDTPATTSTTTASNTRPAGDTPADEADEAQPSDVCGEPGADIAPIRGRTQDAPAECIELGTGDVQVTLRWASAADIDLHVTEPDGTEIWYGDTGPSSTGGQLDVDSNVGCEQEASVENIFWPTGQAPSGTYSIEVNGYQVENCGSGDYTVTARVRGETVLQESGSVGEDETDTYSIEV